jgi:L-ascorbate metabolism protein UlaG (beta-lactamase superfamily)
VQAGVLSGYEDGTFRPNQAITRQEAAVMVARLVGWSENPDGANKFKDRADIAGWSVGAVGAAAEGSLISGYPDGTFRPLMPITRAEAVVVLEKTLPHRATVFGVSGTYGPAEGTETINGNVAVRASGVTLQNVTITGDLLLSKEIGDGDVYLENVKVLGKTVVEGGGSESIHLVNTVLLTVIVNRADGTVRLVAEGSTTVQEVLLQSSVILEEQGLTGDGFTMVSLTEWLPSGSKVTLQGNFETVNIAVQNVKVEIPEGSIASLNVTGLSGNIEIELGAESRIVSLVLEAAAAIFGQGVIEKAIISEQARSSSFEKAPVTQEGPGASNATGGNAGGGGGGGGGGATLQKTSMPTVTGSVYTNSAGFWGTSESGADIAAKLGSLTIGQAKAQHDGTYVLVFTPGTQLTANQTFIVTASAPGKTVSDALTIQVQAVPDEAPVTATPTVTGEVYTNSAGITGTAEPYASIIVRNGNEIIGAALASQNGSYAVKFADETQLTADEVLFVQAAAPGKASSAPIQIMVKAAPQTDPGEQGNSIKLEYLAHSSFILTTDEVAILMDPWDPVSPPMWNLPNFDPPEMPITAKEIDVITISHGHSDHNYADAVEVDDQNILWGVIDNKDFTYTYNPIQQTRGDVTISTEKVWHFPLRPDVERNTIDLSDPEDMERYEGQAANAAFIFETNGMRIVHLGDGMGPIEDGLSTTDIYDYSGLVSSLKGTSGIDILMLPIGGPDGKNPLNFNRLIEAIQTLQPKVVIPMHPWSTLERFVEAVDDVFGAPVYKPSEIRISASDLPSANTPVIWILEKSFQPITDLKETNITDTTVTFSFTQPQGAETAKLQWYDDNDQSWVDAAAVNPHSTTATVTGLAPNTEYTFRLFVSGGTKHGISNYVTVTTALANNVPKLDSLSLSIGGQPVPFTFHPDFALQEEIIVDQEEYFFMTYAAEFNEENIQSVTFEQYQPDPVANDLIHTGTKQLTEDGSVDLGNDVLWGTNITSITVRGKDSSETTYTLYVSSRVELLPNFNYYYMQSFTSLVLFDQISVEEFLDALELRPGATATVWTSYDSNQNEFGTQVTTGDMQNGYVVKITGLDQNVFRVYNVITWVT